MEGLTLWFTETLGQFLSPEIVIFIISMIPLLELRGGLLAAGLLQVPLATAIPICIIGNIIPIPFILLFIKKVFHWMRAHGIMVRFVNWCENRAISKSDKIKQGEFIGLMLFVGIPLPGTGAWMGSLIAALLNIDMKKAVLAELLGLLIATLIMAVFVYGLLGMLF